MIQKIKKIISKKNKTKIICLTAYSKNFATEVDKFADITLVGDSLGSVLYNYETTRKVTLNNMMEHSKSVRMGIKKSLMVVDMPYKTYQNKRDALKNSIKVIKETKCDAIKLEGGKEIVNIIKYLTKRNIPVMGHIGLLPQTSKKFKVKGINSSQEKKILKDAKVISNSGVFAIVIECVLENLARKITKSVRVPTIGIGASRYCDGQILVSDDILGLSESNPKFVKQYYNVSKIIEKSFKRYSKDVKMRRFPSIKNVYK